jgi:hypothetical protein
METDNRGRGKEKSPRQKTARGLGFYELKKLHQPQLEPQEALLLQPPPPTGLAELIENPERIPASIKSTFMDSQVSSRLLSTRNVKPSCSYVASFSFGSSRASLREGPDQPPCIKATRRAESMLFCSMYDLRFCVANSVTSNIRVLLACYLIFSPVILWPQKNNTHTLSIVGLKMQTNLFPDNFY